MNLQQDLEDILSGAKEIGGELLTDLVNSTGNPVLAKVLFDLIGSHVDLAKTVQKTPAGQQALAALQQKQAAAKQAAQAPQAAPAPAAQNDALAAALGGIAAALSGINAKLDAMTPAPAPVQSVAKTPDGLTAPAAPEQALG